MAKWRLTAKHYLVVPGSKWQYKETSRDTGEEAIAEMPVPKYLDPDDPRHCTRDGICVVCHSNPGPREHVFIGPPTPDMEPMDDEAKAISEAESPKWQHPIESLQGNYSASLLTDLQRQIAQTISKPVPSADMEELRRMVNDLAAKNAALQKKVDTFVKA